MTQQSPTVEREHQGPPTLYMLVGLPGSGKTTRAKALEAEDWALRLTPDEWIVALYSGDLDRPHRDAVRDPVEAVQWQVAKRALSLGCNVVLDWGFWSRAERTDYRKRAEALGARVRVIFLDVCTDELWTRISQRDESAEGTLGITQSELEQWSSMFEPPTDEELS